jgi:hypothetical protein
MREKAGELFELEDIDQKLGSLGQRDRNMRTVGYVKINWETKCELFSRQPIVIVD